MLTRLRKDEAGAVLVEATVMLTIMFFFVLGAVDFLMAMYQWNAATKAVQHGARIASVSDPVALDLHKWSGIGGTVDPGEPFPYFKRVCAAGSCSGGTYDANAMDKIVNGRGCSFNPIYCAGMVTFFPRIQAQNVVITYENTGLGYAGRPGATPAVPTITVTLQNIPFQFFFLGALMGFSNKDIQPVATVSGEDLSRLAPCDLVASACP